MQKIKEIIIKYKGYLICLSIIILSIISILLQDMDRKNELVVNNESLKEVDGKIGVYITGAVKTPGVYYLEEGSRIYNLLDVCGGVLEQADINSLNLAQRLKDSDKIIVPIKKENTEEQEEGENNEDVEEKININTADSDELQTLNGIGEVTAQKIIDYRNENEFETIEDIMNVPSIGESKFNNIKEDICVN